MLFNMPLGTYTESDNVLHGRGAWLRETTSISTVAVGNEMQLFYS